MAVSEREKKTCNRRCLEYKQFFIISNNKSCTRNIFVHYINTRQSHGTTEHGCFHGQKCPLYETDLEFWLILGSDNCQKYSWLHLSAQNPLIFIPDQRTLIIKGQNHNRNMVFLNYLCHDEMTAANMIVFSIFDWCCLDNSTAKNKEKATGEERQPWLLRECLHQYSDLNRVSLFPLSLSHNK